MQYNTYLFLNVSYCTIIFLISFIYSNYEKSSTDSGKFEDRLNENTLEKYLTDENKVEYSIQEVNEQIKSECQGFLLSELKIVLFFSFILMALFFFLGKESIAFYFIISFFLGTIISFVCVYQATIISVSYCEVLINRARSGLKSALKSAIDSSSRLAILMGSISLFSLLIMTLTFKFFVGNNEDTFLVLCGYGFGCTYTALFCRISGGIFTKGADISCDIIGKMSGKENELVSTLVENDSEIPSSVADNVGDAIGDLAGSILDITASISETICAVSIILSFIDNSEEETFCYVIFFFSLFSTCQLAFILIELYLTHFRYLFVIDMNSIEAILFKFLITITISMMTVILVFFYQFCPSEITFKSIEVNNYYIMSAVLLGLCASTLICLSTYYYTGKSFKYIQKLKEITLMSSSLNVIYGLTIGYFSTLLPMIIIALTIMISNYLCGIFGVAFASFGFLLNLPVILLYQMFGPISDISLGIVSLCKYGNNVAKEINQLDIIGNTMSAVVKGFTSGSAGLISFGLYGAVMTRAEVSVINLHEISSLIFILLGGVTTYMIESLSMYATTKNAMILLEDSRQQISLRKKVAESKIKPDYFEIIQISAQNAFKSASMISWLCIIIILSVAFLFRFNGLVCFLTGIIIAGIPITISSSNSGSAWDNAKKLVEMEVEEEIKNFDKEYYSMSNSDSDVVINKQDDAVFLLGKSRKNSLMNAVIADNVGDAFKDIAGPTINIFIKFSSYFSLIIINYLLIY